MFPTPLKISFMFDHLKPSVNLYCSLKIIQKCENILKEGIKAFKISYQTLGPSFKAHSRIFNVSFFGIFR
jgi:hypothetical protein